MPKTNQARSPDRGTRSIDETARMIGCSRNGVLDLIHNGDLQAIQIGNRRLVTLTSIQRLLGIQDPATPQPAPLVQVLKPKPPREKRPEMLNAPWSVTQIATALGCHTGQIYDQINRFDIEAVKIGKLKRIPAREAQRLLGVSPSEATLLREVVVEKEKAAKRRRLNKARSAAPRAAPVSVQST